MPRLHKRQRLDLTKLYRPVQRHSGGFIADAKASTSREFPRT